MIPIPDSNLTSAHTRALLDHIQSGAYPESEYVISADLSPKALPNILRHVRNARTELEEDLRDRSRSIAPDVDGWISNAKRLRNDIQSSQREAGEISEQGEHSVKLQLEVQDAASKIKLLEEEHAFNHAVRVSLKRLQNLRERLDKIQNDILRDEFLEIGDGIAGFEHAVETDLPYSSSNVRAALSSKATQLKSDATERLLAHWNSLIIIDQVNSRVIVKAVETEAHTSLAVVAQAMQRLQILGIQVSRLAQAIDQLIIHPRLRIQSNGTIHSLEVDEISIHSGSRSNDLSAGTLFSDLQNLIVFLQERLPSQIIELLSVQLGSQMISGVVSPWLHSAVPSDLDDLESFQATVRLVKDFADRVDAHHWPGKADLDQWVRDVPELWVKKRCEFVLDRTRKFLAAGITSTSTVERTETQIVSKGDDVFANKDSADDWNATWSDDEHDENDKPSQRPSSSSGAADNDDEADAWGLDEEQEAAPEEPPKHDEDSADAWGWGDEDEASSPVAKKPAAAKVKEHKTNGLSKQPSADDRQQVTLRETFTITSLPPEVLGIIEQVLEDCRILNMPPYDHSELSQCGEALKQVPITAVALFRAISSDAYAMHLCGSMLLYNDCQWLAQQLSSKERFADSSLPVQAGSLDVHGKRAYSKEMDSQRTIINDLLDGAQGFSNCTQYPFNQECDIAVASSIDRIRQLHKQWTEVLSHSALLQALGSLISAVCSKLILDVEDMSDISEPESQQLAKYCARIGSLEDIFTPQAPDGSSAGEADTMPLTAAYVSSWFKFQYLANILESNLADIKYLWIEGGLSLEFEVNEVIDLIVALFAEGPHRRSAINEIRAAQPAR